MAHMVESMFYDMRETPWHGLGLPVIGSLTSEDAIKMAGIDWLVEKHNVVVDGKVVQGYKANVRTKAKLLDEYGKQQYNDNGAIAYRPDEVLGIVSDRYSIVQNFDAFSFVDNLISDEVRYETAGSLQNGKRVWILAKMPERKILDDAFEPYICFSNSFDGTSAIRVNLTPIRVVCSNTLNLCLNTAKRSWSTKHMGDMQSKLEAARMTLELADTYYTELELEAQRLAKKAFTDAEFKDLLEELFNKKDEDKVLTNRQIENIKYNITAANFCYDQPDVEKFRGTAWGVINSFSDFAYHVKPLRQTQNYSENQWAKNIDGNSILDKVYELVAA